MRRAPQHCPVYAAHCLNPALALFHQLKHLRSKRMLACHPESAGIPALGIQHGHRAQAADIVGNLLVGVLAEIERIVVHFDFYRVQDFIQRISRSII